MPAKHLYFIGTAGCGKSTLTNAYLLWLQNQGYDGITVNLDPGADTLLYTPDVDVQDWINLTDVMRECGLGPNGAQIAAADMLALNIKEIAQVVAGHDTDFVLLDTPGQVELFTFRKSSKIVIDELSGDLALLVYLYDPSLAKSANGFVSTLMLSASVHFRLPFPMLPVLAKADMLTEVDREKVEAWSRDYYALFNALLDESAESQTQINAEFLQALEAVGASKAVMPVSADTGEGLEDIYNAAQQVFEGGEDVER